MISGSQESIAIVIQTDAKLQGILAARAGVKDLGNQVQATSEQSRKAWQASGGDMARFATELAKVTAGEKQVAAGATQIAAEMSRIAPASRGITQQQRRHLPAHAHGRLGWRANGQHHRARRGWARPDRGDDSQPEPRSLAQRIWSTADARRRCASRVAHYQTRHRGSRP